MYIYILCIHISIAGKRREKKEEVDRAISLNSYKCNVANDCNTK